MTKIERARRLGRHGPYRSPPIILKLTLFNIKESILSNGRKLKYTVYIIDEDFSLPI